MKYSFSVFTVLISTVVSGLSHEGFGGHAHLSRSFHHKHLAGRSSPHSHNIQERRTMLRKVLSKRKTPIGEGDSVTQPSNLAQGSFTASQGCTCWHTVASGEVCLGLIDKSSSGFDITVFGQYNPQVNSDCSNLVVGQAYCVDDGRELFIYIHYLVFKMLE